MSYICSDPLHDGDPSRVHPTDRCEERIEYRRLSDQGREKVIKVGDVCRPCIRRRHGVSTVQIGMFQ